MNTSGGGGVCDCGDVEAWKEGEACEIHQQGQDVDMEEVPWNCFHSAQFCKGWTFAYTLFFCSVVCQDCNSQTCHAWD